MALGNAIRLEMQPIGNFVQLLNIIGNPFLGFRAKTQFYVKEIELYINLLLSTLGGRHDTV